jgi:hypothetical protein
MGWAGMSTNVKILWKPNPGPQTAFLSSNAREVLYGGAAGGGKTDAIMMLPLYRCYNPKHRSIIFRRTRKMLQEVIDRQRQLYADIVPGAKYNNEESRWYWPSGAVTQMGYMEHEQDRFNFKTFEYDMVLFDELTTFTEKQYLFMFSRNRTKDKTMPPLMRGGTNPGDVGHQWVYDRFIVNKDPFRIYETTVEADVEGMGKLSLSTTAQFIPAKIGDNPTMADRESYIAGLKLMKAEDADAYLEGSWLHFVGQMFKKLPRVAEALEWTKGSIIVRAMDYGWADPLCMQWWRVHKDGMWEGLKELYQAEMGLDAIAHYVHLIEQQMKIRPSISICGHDAKKQNAATKGESVVSMLAQRGVWFENSNRDPAAGWARIRSLTDRNKVIIRPNAMPDLLRTMPNLVRDPSRPDTLKEHQEDHAVECFRYAVMAVPETGLQTGLAMGPGKTETAEPDPVFARIMKELSQNQGNTYPQLGGWS